MINKSFHSLLRGVSVLPALLVAPAMADTYLGLLDGYVSSVSTQLQGVMDAQNASGFDIGKITIGTNMSIINDHSLRYDVADRNNATQYVKMEQVALPVGIGGMSITVPSLIEFELNIIKDVLGDDIARNSDGSVDLNLAHAEPLMGLFADADSLGSRTWFLNSANSAMKNGKIEDGYLYTTSDFSVDGQYGEMITTFISSYEDDLVDTFGNMDFNGLVDRLTTMLVVKAGFDSSASVFAKDFILRDMFGLTTEEVENMTSEQLSAAMRAYLNNLKTSLATLNSGANDVLKLNVGEVAMTGGKVTFANNVNLKTSDLNISGGDLVVANGANVNVTIDDVDIAYNGQYIDSAPSSSASYAKRNAVISGANTKATVANGGILTVGGADFAINDGATLDNEGTLNLTSNALVVDQYSVVNLGNTGVINGDVTLNGTMSMSLNQGDSARITADTFDGTGVLNLIISNPDTYTVFGGNGIFANVENPVYDLVWNGGEVTASVKSVENLAADNAISQESAVTVAGLSESSSAVLNDLSVQMQEKLAEGTPEAKREVEQATAAINPETESVAQSVAGSVQNTVTNLASSRMSMPATGRAGGDVNLTANGVWAQGLYNKTKMNDSFNGYTRGVALGVDGKINNDIIVGAGYAFNNSDIASSSRDTDIDIKTIFVYGQYKPAEWYVNAVMNYTWSEYTEKGTAMGTPVSGEYSADSFGMAVNGGYDFACGVTPELGLRYMHVNGESYTNSLGTQNKFDSTDYLTGTLGAKYGFNVVANDEMLFRPELRYALKYDFVSDGTQSTVMMPGTAAYTLDGDRLPRVGNEFGIGLTMKYREMDVSVTYDIDVRKDYTSQTGMLKFRYNF